MRIRKKVLFLHTSFSLGLAAILLIALRPAITEVVDRAELSQSRLVLRSALASAVAQEDGSVPLPRTPGLTALTGDARLASGTAEQLDLSPETAAAARNAPGTPVAGYTNVRRSCAVAYMEGDTYWAVFGRIEEARAAIFELYILVAAALLAIYAIVAAALEFFVMPQNVYGPIRRMLAADQAVQQGDQEQELIPDSVIPADEFGEIMRSRNESIIALRRHEKALAEALAELERAANDLKKKNHLLEAAQRNLVDADRLAGLGIMSAGIAHELNTPLAVLKGLIEKVNADPGAGVDPAQAALMLRVVRRLERLGDSLLDYARVRPPQTRTASLRAIIDEAITLVRLDRDASESMFENRVGDGIDLDCDVDRMIQVMVNLLRNSSEAVGRQNDRRPPAEGRVTITADTFERAGREWVSITIADDGPGIDPDVLPRLFEPFASTRLDAKGTGLGLAVSDGIVREHGGLILARNRPPPHEDGAEFEVLLPRISALPQAALADSPSVPAPHEPAER